MHAPLLFLRHHTSSLCYRDGSPSPLFFKFLHNFAHYSGNLHRPVLFLVLARARALSRPVLNRPNRIAAIIIGSNALDPILVYFGFPFLGRLRMHGVFVDESTLDS